MENRIACKFVKRDVCSLDSLKDTFAYQMKVKLLKNEPLTREEKNRLTQQILNTGYIRHMGWHFSFRKFYKVFVIKQHGQWYEHYGIDKTALRNAIYGTIDKIVEVN